MLNIKPTGQGKFMADNPLLKEFIEKNDSKFARCITDVFDSTLGQTEDMQTEKMKDVLNKILKERLDEISED
jgi:hypothetical protein